MMKNTNAAASGKRKRDRAVSARSNGEIWVLDIRSVGTKGTRKGGDKFSGGTRGKDRDVPNGVFGGNNKKKP